MRAGVFVCFVHWCVPTSLTSLACTGSSAWSRLLSEWPLAAKTAGMWAVWTLRPHLQEQGERRLRLLSTGSAQAAGCRLPLGQMWNTFQLRVGFGGGDQMFADDDAGQWAGMDFGSQTWVCLRINWQSFPEIESLGPHATLTKVRIPWEIKSRLHQILTKWPWTSYLNFLSVYCNTGIIITSWNCHEDSMSSCKRIGQHGAWHTVCNT